MFGKKKKPEPVMIPGNDGQAVEAAEEGKALTLHVTVFPKEGGRPYTAEVEPDDEGYFDIGENKRFKITRGSVWEESGIPRVIVNEGNPQTINAYTLTGDDSFDPVALHGVACNNLWMQLDTISKKKNPWKQASTWGMMALGVILILVMLWQIKTLSSGLEGVEEGLKNIQITAQGGPGPSQEAIDAGHQPIAPGGRS